MNKYLALVSLAVFTSQAVAQQAVWGQCQWPIPLKVHSLTLSLI